MTNQISRDELRSAIADKLCAHFGVTAGDATDEQVFQAAAIVIREILSRLHTFDSRTAPEREVHYLSMEFLMGRSLIKVGNGFIIPGLIVFTFRCIIIGTTEITICIGRELADEVIQQLFIVLAREARRGHEQIY